MATTWTQEDFRFRNDDGDETAANWYAAAHTNITPTVGAANLKIRLRTAVKQTGSTAATLTGRLYISKNGGAYAQASSSSSGGLKVVDSTYLTDDAATSQQLSSGTFVAGKVDDSTGQSSATGSMGQNTHTEHEWMLQLTFSNLADGDYFDLRVRNSTTVLGTYTYTPRITVTKNTAPTVALNTQDALSTSDTTPTLNFTGTDANSDDCRYNIQIYIDNGTITGLDFPGVGTVRGFYFSSPPAIYGASGAGLTYIWRAYPRQQAGYYTTFFWNGNNTTFSGGNYYGMHPYPNPPPSGTAHLWEIAVEAQDFTNGTTAYDQWFSQAARVWGDVNAVKEHYFYWNLPNTDSGNIVHRQSDSSINNGAFPSPVISFGDAPWNQGVETYYGIIRGIQIYDVLLTTSQINQLVGLDTDAAVLAKCTELGISAPWYLNVNPTPSDISDKSGNGHDPSWWNSGSKPSLYSASNITTYVDAVSGTDAGFSGDPDNSDPFTSGQAVDFTVQSALGAAIYSWKVRAIDPSGANSYGSWSSVRTFTITAGGNSTPLALDGGITPAGTIQKSNLRAFSGSFIPSASLTRSTYKAFAGSVSPSADAARLTGKLLTGGIAPAGQLGNSARPLLSGSLTPAGTVAALRTFMLSGLSGAISFAGTLTRSTWKYILGGIAPEGTVTRSTSKGFISPLTPAAVLSALKTFLLLNSGALSPVGNLARSAKKELVGAASLAGIATRSSSRVLTGSITLAGTVLRSVSKLVTGTLSLSGAVSALKTIRVSISGAIDSVGNLSRSIAKSVSGAITPSGNVMRGMSKTLSGSLAPDGAVIKRAPKNLAGALAPVGVVTVMRTALLAVAGTLAPIGTLARNILKSLTGAIAPVGLTVKKASKAFTGSVASNGSAIVGRYYTRSLAGEISLAGEATRVPGISLTGAIAPGGAITKQVNKTLAGAIVLLRRFAALLVGAIYPPSPIVFQPERSYTLIMPARTYVAYPQRTYIFTVSK
jgi:hypothetical protein